MVCAEKIRPRILRVIAPITAKENFPARLARKHVAIFRCHSRTLSEVRWKDMRRITAWVARNAYPPRYAVASTLMLAIIPALALAAICRSWARGLEILGRVATAGLVLALGLVVRVDASANRHVEVNHE